MSRLTDTLRDRLYADEARRDPVIPFLEVVGRFITPESRVLDIGAGAGEINPYDFKGRCGEMVGVDMDERVVDNPLLDRGVVGDGESLPFDDESFDVVFSIYVLEHVADPASFAAEIKRVLKPGGVVLSITPNKWHYVAQIASWTPLRFHRWVNERRGRASDDTFPTTYLLNSRRDQEAWFGAPDFDTDLFERIEVSPNYLMFSVPTMLAGVAYERVVNASPLLERLRVVIISAFRKR